ncbi:DUF2868 domain-containing protein [Alloalcanivorax xenomutans]|uniref:DUF2868 domain-containing protein n=1 Tax=Alloalcanivorax xenomutans TaxID=1094342 RepID=UPI001F40FC62|nr:DUF2868 domain-containing protein [Alloalcanivorax xenomutans]MCE7523774.1 DUF2868 domain-containing protein [Alloalcanivorax xenomutans]
MPYSPLRLLLDFDDQYQRDQRQSPDFLHRRDRQLALQAQQRDGSTPLPEDWLRTLGADRVGGGHDPRLRTWRRARVLFVLGGAVLGVLTMLGLLYYDGSQRINVTLLLGFAALQLTLAVLTTVQAGIGWRPWGRLLDRAGATPSALHDLQPPLAARVAHSGGLAFAIAALLTLLVQVVVRDLAFGWSTTLQTSAPAYHELTHALAWPWRQWLPAAVPSLELVEQSRFFRISDQTPADPARLGAWWAFLAMVWLVYVVLPRLVFLALSRAQLRWRAKRLLARHPGMAALRQRFEQPWVDTGAGNATPAPELDQGKAADGVLPESGTVIHWAGAGLADDGLFSALAGGERAPLRLAAGGSASLEHDRAVLEQAGQRREPVLILAQGWEPPTGELADFLDDARQQWGEDTVIALVPLAADPGGALSDATQAQWRRFVDRRQHPHLRLCRAPEVSS